METKPNEPYYKFKEKGDEDDDKERSVRKQLTLQMKGLKSQLEWLKRQIEYLTFAETLAVVNQIRALDKLRLYVRPIIHETITNPEGKMHVSEEQMKLIEKGILRILKISNK